MPEKTVSVSPETEAQLSRLAERTGLSVADIVRYAVEAYEARMFFDDMDETYAVLEADFKEWGAYMADLSAWIDAGEPRAPAPEEAPTTASNTPAEE
jgi:predicted DNA-binding protein